MENNKNPKRPTREELSKYVEENIDMAIEKGYIKAFYQPVVRTFTNEVCGMEALARWDDPVYGLLAPDIFIGTLEETKQIHKLDSCIIKRICEDYKKSVKADEDVVTISFNLSRLDFHLTDIHEVIEDALKENLVPREAIRVEITESTLENDEQKMHDVIDRFVDRGLRVWMDDFGSGYSSLNVLKDYHFDTLKIDMVFLRNFDKRSREIVKSVVDMAKRIGVHTLAEGVETKEHLDFLKSIGCEKAQGYYIGKPMPYRECRDYLKEKGYRLEAPGKRAYFHEIGKVNVLSGGERQNPLSIVEYNGERIRYLYANDSYMNALLSLGISDLKEVEEEFLDKGKSFRERFENLFYKAEISNESVTTSFIRNESLCYAKVEKISECLDEKAFLCSVQNLSADTLMAKNNMLSDYADDILMIYDRIELCDLDTGRIEWIVNNYQAKRNYEKLSLRESIPVFAEEEIYPEDRERYLKFSDIDTIEERILKSGRSCISEPFRTHTVDGTYAWMLHTVIFAGEISERRLLFIYKRLSNETIALIESDNSLHEEKRRSEKEGVLNPNNLWNSLKYSNVVAFFWKDRERRFVGVSRKFLEYYGLDSESELIGKTDEDMGWHVSPEGYKNDEERILAHGEQTYMVPGTCICKGEIRRILATKIPVYDNGAIVGLMGYFVDMEDYQNEKNDIKAKISVKDEESGTLNFIGLIESLLRYRDAFEFSKTNFAMHIFDINRFRSFNRDYGINWGNKLLVAVAKKIQDAVGVQGVAGRLSGDNFLVIKQFNKKDELDLLVYDVNKKVEEITEVDGVSCTVYLTHGVSTYSDIRDLQKMFFYAEESLNTNKLKRR